MAVFIWEAKTRIGETRSGEMEADSSALVTQRLRAQQLPTEGVSEGAMGAKDMLAEFDVDGAAVGDADAWGVLDSVRTKTGDGSFSTLDDVDALGGLGGAEEVADVAACGAGEHVLHAPFERSSSLTQSTCANRHAQHASFAVRPKLR